jgi:predicted nucleic acid-binding protein
MITAVDSSVLLDILLDDPIHAENSEKALRTALVHGKCIVNECVVAEIFPALGDEQKVRAFLADVQLDFVPTCLDCALHSGKIFSTYLARKGRAKKVVADFLIAAHAQHHAERLLTRDRGFYRDYFSQLRLLEPG